MTLSAKLGYFRGSDSDKFGTVDHDKDYIFTFSQKIKNDFDLSLPEVMVNMCEVQFYNNSPSMVFCKGMGPSPPSYNPRLILAKINNYKVELVNSNNV